jgi:uncharacterized protein YozE (UPF0346 family)
MRYRDDILVLLFKERNKKKIDEIVQLANKMYDTTNYPKNKLDVELEELYYNTISFLEYKIVLEDNKLILTDNNTNISFDLNIYDDEQRLIIKMKKINLWKRRYPSMESNYEYQIYSNTIVNVLEKTKKRNNNNKFYLFSQICNIIELMCLKYTSKLIVNSLLMIKI